MLAPFVIPQKYLDWNSKWGAPYGRKGYGWPLRGTRFDIRRRGPFAWQTNNSTREFEYPWAYDEISSRGPRQTIVDVGASLGGMQFALALMGHTVIAVDPGLKAGGLGWDVDLDMHKWIGKRLNAPVRIISESLANADLGKGVADIVLCVSSLEHFSDQDLAATSATLPSILKDDGLVVMTVDCFLDVVPFTRQPTNRWGRNISIPDFLSQASLELKAGHRNELVGHEEFVPERILSNLSNYHVGQFYPCLAQCFTATKRPVSIRA